MSHYTAVSLTIGVVIALLLSWEFVFEPPSTEWYTKRYLYPWWFLAVTVLFAIVWPICAAVYIYTRIRDDW